MCGGGLSRRLRRWQSWDSASRRQSSWRHPLPEPSTLLLTLGDDPCLHWSLGSLHNLLQHLAFLFSHQRDRASSPASTCSSPYPVHIVFDSVGHGEVDHLEIRANVSELWWVGPARQDSHQQKQQKSHSLFSHLRCQAHGRQHLWPPGCQSVHP